MKKSFILLLLIIIAGVFITSCPMGTVFYCPYCASTNISKVEDEKGVFQYYQCGRRECGKKFGAKEIVPQPK
jgi:transposase-like protein